MRREPHVRFREGGGVKLLSATRPVSTLPVTLTYEAVERPAPHRNGKRTDGVIPSLAMRPAVARCI